MYRKAIPAESDGPAPAGYRRGAHCECAPKRAGRSGSGSASARSQMEDHGSCRRERSRRRP